MKKKRTALFVAPVALAVLVGVIFLIITKVRKPPVKQLILISIDTCRADHLSCYGYPEKTTPNIDALAREAVMFKRVISPVPMTLPAHTSMLTGTNPVYHGVHDNIGYKVGEFNRTLAELMHEKGFFTGAVVSSFVLDSRFGLNQGFDSYNDKFVHPMSSFYHNERRGDETTQFAKAFIEKHCKEPFFLFVHFYDPHDAYRPPEPFATFFRDNPYAGEIAFVDSCIGEIIAKLKELGLYKSALVIVTADHGESLGEHQEKTHDYFIYQSTLQVPLIIKLPGGLKGKTVEDNAGLIDIVPTVCGILGIDIPRAVAGQDLSPYLTGKIKHSNEERYFYCESLKATEYGCSPLLGVVDNNWKYIQTARPELYDLDKDPGEHNNLAAKLDKRARFLQGQLKSMIAGQKGAEEQAKTTLDEKTRQRLESLGYISGGALNENLAFDNTKKDAKDYINLHQEIILVNSYMKVKQYGEALETSKKMFLEPFPGKLYGHFFIGQIEFEQNDIDESISNMLEFFSDIEEAKGSGSEYLQNLQENICEGHNYLGLAYAEKNDFEKAMSHYLKAEDADPNNPIVYYNIGNLYLKQGRDAEAADYYIKALDKDPELAEAYQNLGLVYRRQNQVEKSVSCFEQALKLKPDSQLTKNELQATEKEVERIKAFVKESEESLSRDPNQIQLHRELAAIFFQQGDIKSAMSHWESVLRLDPNDASALNNSAYVYATQAEGAFKDSEKAVQMAVRACELTGYKDPVMLNTLSIAYAAAGKNSDAVETAKKALELAVSSGNDGLARTIRANLETFQSRHEP
jgi:arylsulfatase A-like enzyme/Flp pilus assembly protein TadD